MRNLTSEELNQALNYGILDSVSIRMQLENMEKMKLLEMHPYEIFECSGSWFTYLPNEEGKRKQVKRKKKEDIEKLICDFYREKTENPTIEEVFNEWNKTCLECGDIKPSTFDRHNDFYKRHFGEMGKRRIKSVTVREWAVFLKEQVNLHQLTRKAYNGLHQITFNLLKNAKIKGLIDFRITEIDEYVSFGKNTFRTVIKQENLGDFVEDSGEVFTVEETAKILSYLVEHLDSQNAGILLMFLTGMRIGEISALKKEFVRENVIMVRHSETKYRDQVSKKYIYEVSDVKTDAGYRDIVLPEGCEWVGGLLKQLNSTSEYVFINEKGRMTTNCFRRRQERICKKLGIKPKSPHKDRKTYATILSDYGFDENFKLRQMGHANISTTEENYHKDRKTVSKKAEMLSVITEFDIVKHKAI